LDVPLVETKQSIRNALLQKRKTVNNSQESLKIYNNLLKVPIFDQAQSIMSYMNISSEVDTGSINKYILDEDKTLLLPVLINKEIKPSKFTFDNNLKIGEFNIPEPSPFREYDKHWIELVLVPGVAFSSKTGHRLGYGKGFFDRFLKDFNGKKIGLCFEAQLVADLPFDESDISMDYLVTEERVIKISK
jgi:5-formyltetrahydrofolate cyclo-ligase